MNNENEGGCEFSQPEVQLIEQLRHYPEMMERVRRILDITRNADGLLKTADEVEELLIQELRRLGNTSLSQWATQAEARESDEAIAICDFGLEKLKLGSRLHDFKVKNGTQVQVKTTQQTTPGKGVGLGLNKRSFDHLIVIQLLDDGYGILYDGGKRIYQKSGVMFLRSQNVWNDGLHLEEVAFISPARHKEMESTCVEPGDVLLNITGASIGRSAVVPDDFDEANVSQHVSVVRLADKALRNFLDLSIIAPDFQSRIMQVQVGVSRECLSMARLEDFVIALPPLPEQRRIVAKVQELLALCDELEARQSTARAHRTRFVHSTLDNLTSAKDEAGFRKRASFILHKSALVLDDVSTLRQTILALAVEGRLVPQNPEDEPAEGCICFLHYTSHSCQVGKCQGSNFGRRAIGRLRDGSWEQLRPLRGFLSCYGSLNSGKRQQFCRPAFG